ncbi:hypothetical protein H9Q74_012641 [Fusarium xylarioides]|nr:hypothetical protein H9Q71_003708 [Fusarium xylarioides]KAG5813582.1 hypothetical protein H9Q74_012641 [Fusarium xylarioides]
MITNKTNQPIATQVNRVSDDCFSRDTIGIHSVLNAMFRAQVHQRLIATCRLRSPSPRDPRIALSPLLFHQNRGTQGLFSSRASAIRAAPPLLACDRSLRPTLLGPYLQMSSPSFLIPRREDALRGEAQIPDLATLL